MLDMAIIHIKEDTKQLLVKLMVEIRRKEKKRVSYDEIIKRLLVGEKGKYKKRLLPLFGSLDKEQADRDLAELKFLEGRRCALLSESSLKKDWLRPEDDEAWSNL
jgi:hypothetical protein